MPHLLQLLLLLVIIVFAAKVAGALSVRYGQPAVFGEILVGLLLGPTVIDMLRLWPFASAHDSLGNVVKDFSEIGVILLMFVAGLETDLDQMKRVGRVAFWAAAGGVILPMAGGAAAARAFGYGWREAIFIGADEQVLLQRDVAEGEIDDVAGDSIDKGRAGIACVEIAGLDIGHGKEV